MYPICVRATTLEAVSSTHASHSTRLSSTVRSFILSISFLSVALPRLSSFPILVSGPALSDVYKFQEPTTTPFCINSISCSFVCLGLGPPPCANITNGIPFPCRPILAQTSVRVRVRRPSVRPRNSPRLQKYLMVRARERERMWIRSAKLGPNSASPLLVEEPFLSLLD